MMAAVSGDALAPFHTVDGQKNVFLSADLTRERAALMAP